MEYAFWIVIFCGLLFCGIKIGGILAMRNIPRVLQPTPMMVVCAWCRKVLRPGSEPMSHSICDDCLKIHFPELHER